MKKHLLAAFACLLLAGTARSQVVPTTPDIVSSSNIDLTFATQYNWRGFVLAENTLMPSGTVSFFDNVWSLGFWGAIPLEQESRFSKEYDVFTNFNFKVNESFSIAAGVTYYTFQGSNKSLEGNTFEAFVSGTYLWKVTKTDVITLNLSYYQELSKEFAGISNLAKYSYVEGTAGYSLGIGPASLKLEGTLGTITKVKYNYGSVKATLELPIGKKGLYVRGSASHTQELKRDAASLTRQGLDGVVVMVSFGINI